jgi:hypothetical protein
MRLSVLQDCPLKKMQRNISQLLVVVSLRAWRSPSWIPEPIVMEERKSTAAALVRDFEHLLYRESKVQKKRDNIHLVSR